MLCTCVLLANSPFPWKSAAGKQMRLGKRVSTPQWAVRFCSIHTVVREHLTMRAYKSQEALRSNNRLMLSLNCKHVTLNLNIVCPHGSTFHASYMSAEQSPPPNTHTTRLESLERHLFCDHILHVSGAVFRLVHAVSSQQVSEEGFVSNGGIGMTTWGGRGGGVRDSCHNWQKCCAHAYTCAHPR